jgi:uncharacterized protein (DUF362 family)
MAKGVSIKFRSYLESVPAILNLIGLPKELSKHNSIVLKPRIQPNGDNTPKDFVEAVLAFCLENKNPDAKVFIAEGVDGEETIDLFQKEGYKELAEKYSVSLLDLNEAETTEINSPEFLQFDKISYPKILSESFVISLPKLSETAEDTMEASLSNMLGAFPASHYTGFFSSKKTKIRKWPIKYSIHDILKCKMPDFALIDASHLGVLLAGLPLEVDKQASKLLGKDVKSVAHLKMIDESIALKAEREKKREEQKAFEKSLSSAE